MTYNPAHYDRHLHENCEGVGQPPVAGTVRRWLWFWRTGECPVCCKPHDVRGGRVGWHVDLCRPLYIGPGRTA
jgi:hypothetical protein